jgi:hypothetical protein
MECMQCGREYTRVKRQDMLVWPPSAASSDSHSVTTTVRAARAGWCRACGHLRPLGRTVPALASVSRRCRRACPVGSCSGPRAPTGAAADRGP